MWHRLTLLLLWCISSVSAAWEQDNGQGFSARGSASTDSSGLTDTFQITLALKAPTGYKVDAQELTDHLLDYGESPSEAFKLLKVDSHSTSSGAATTTTLVFTLDPLIPGPGYLTFRDITFQPPSSAQLPVTLKSRTLTVDITALDEQDMLPVADVLPLENKPILSINPENEEEIAQQDAEQPSLMRQAFLERVFPWHYLVLFPLAVVMVFGAARFILRISKELKSIRKPPTPQETASKKLRALAKGDLFERANFNGFYVQLTQILRDYIAARYQLAAPEMTTEEFMQAMATSEKFDVETRQTLIDLLQYADGVKFAKQPSTAENCTTALAYAKKFITKSVFKQTL